MYVPPIRGSEIRVWNAEMPTNCTVLVDLSREQTWRLMDLRGKRGQYGVNDHKNEKHQGNGLLREVVYNHSCCKWKKEPEPERVEPWSERAVAFRPFCGKPTSNNLKWEIDEDHDRKVFSPETLFNKLKACASLTGRKAYLREQMNDHQ